MSRRRLTTDEAVEREVRALLKEGWRVQNGKHLKLVHPSGAAVITGRTPSDRRSGLNFAAQVRKVKLQIIERHGHL